MQLYAIRRPYGWRDGDDLREAAARSLHMGDEERTSAGSARRSVVDTVAIRPDPVAVES